MDVLTEAADAVFSNNHEEELCIPLTPTKDSRRVFGELTNTINISPDKFANSPLQALFTAPTLGAFNSPLPKGKVPISSSNSGSRSIGRGTHGKSFSSPSATTDGSLNGYRSPRVDSGSNLGRSPLTPMTNLKLLTRVASMEESIGSKKVLFQSESQNTNKENNFKKTSKYSALDDATKITKTRTPRNAANIRRHNSECLGQTKSKSNLTKLSNTLRKHPTSCDYPTPSSPGNLVMERLGSIPPLEEATTSRSTEGTRKEKSLGLLSDKFLEQFPMEVSFLETPRRLVIDEVASMLGTERRRVYDIVNVLESLNMATRVQKNMYQWMGKLHLEETLGRLKALGQKFDIGTQLQALQHFDEDFKFPQRIKTSLINEGEKGDSRREKSLGILCQKFLMILLVSPEPRMISLDNAVRLLVGEVGEEGEKLRTRGRRLYDIANVLTSLGLVKRVPTAKAFQYVGPEVEAVTNDEDTLGVLHRHSLLPSRFATSGSKESVSSFGDYDVTPSDIVAPVQKRGRPRKLSTDFTTAILPASKRSRLQRTHSEDITPQRFARHPSLQDICQVAEAEREKLLQTEQRKRSHSTDGSQPIVVSTYSSTATTDKVNKKFVPSCDFRPIKITSSRLPGSILQRRLTTRTKVPVALTFQSSPEDSIIQQSHDAQSVIQNPTIKKQDMKRVVHTVNHHSSQPYCNMKSGTALQEQKSRTHTDDYPSTCPVSTVPSPVNSHFRRYVLNKPSSAASVAIQKSEDGVVSDQLNNHVISLSSGSQNAQVIKVITRTKRSAEQDASTVITVLPAGGHSNSEGSLPSRKVIVPPVGGFHHVSSGTYTNGQKITTNLIKKYSENFQHNSKAFTVHPYTICTVSNTQGNQKPLISPINSLTDSHSSSSRTLYCSPKERIEFTEVVPTPQGVPSVSMPFSQDPGQMCYQENATGNSVPHVSPMTGPRVITFPHSASSEGESKATWQPSPDGSSTDSELELIFGNTFSFPRPKSLIKRTSSHSAMSSRKTQK